MSDPQSNLIIRPADPADLDATCRLVAAVVDALRRAGIDQWDEAYPDREQLAADTRRRELRLMPRDGHPIALCALNARCDPAYANGRWEQPEAPFRVLHRLCVDPEYQGLGLAHALLRHIEAEARAAGCETLRLDVFTKNPTAQALYRSAGYRCVGQARWRKGVFDLMEKKLRRTSATADGAFTF